MIDENMTSFDFAIFTSAVAELLDFVRKIKGIFFT